MVWKEQLSHLESSFQVLFLELIQVALGSKERLSKIPSEEEWNYLFLTAQKQAVSGLAFNALVAAFAAARCAWGAEGSLGQCPNVPEMVVKDNNSIRK